jgi:hypothetical protein
MAEVNMSESPMQRRRNPFRVVADLAALSNRVRELEDEVSECRRLHHRVAELTDVVQELLVPLSQRDQDRVDEILAKYTDQLG